MPGDKWKDKDVALLLHVWSDMNVQDNLSLVAEEDKAFDRTPQQVKVKLKGLEYDWRRIRQQTQSLAETIMQTNLWTY